MFVSSGLGVHRRDGQKGNGPSWFPARNGPVVEEGRCVVVVSVVSFSVSYCRFNGIFSMICNRVMMHRSMFFLSTSTDGEEE